MRAIDADALKEDLTRFYDNEVTARNLIDEQPTIQPEIVRCKDCKYWKRSSCCEGYCGEIDMEGFDEDHYCGFAEWREVTT